MLWLLVPVLVCYGPLVHSGHPLCKGLLHSKSISVDQYLFASAVERHSSADSVEAHNTAPVRLVQAHTPDSIDLQDIFDRAQPSRKQVWSSMC